jgi:hypothetical protein
MMTLAHTPIYYKETLQRENTAMHRSLIVWVLIILQYTVIFSMLLDMLPLPTPLIVRPPGQGRMLRD